MIINQKRVAASSRLRTLLCIFLLIAAAIAVVAAISNARDVDQAGSAFSEHDGVQIGRVSANGPTPTPFPCPLCWFARTRTENFEALTPPQLPGGWLATNALGPPPLWVTSN